MGAWLVGRRLYFADSESSAVRFADLDGRDGPEVETIVGKGLFEFCDEDGQGGHVRLQHPYDLAAGPGPGGAEVLYVADTYNDRVKRVDPATRRSHAFVGSGEPGHEDGDSSSPTRTTTPRASSTSTEPRPSCVLSRSSAEAGGALRAPPGRRPSRRPLPSSAARRTIDWLDVVSTTMGASCLTAHRVDGR
jgi:hypothetical protein